MNIQYPKVLVVSSTPFSKTQNNGKTLSSFFCGYPSENIAQLSFSYGNTDESVCRRYYFLSTGDIKRKSEGTSAQSRSQNENEEDKSKKSVPAKFFHLLSEKRFPSAIWQKNRLWNRDLYYRAHLSAWIEDFAPDVVFFQGFGVAYGYDVVLWICEKYHLPLILQLTDDYTSNLYKLSPLSYYNRQYYLTGLKRTIGMSHAVIAISATMQNEYSERFGGNIITMMNSVDCTSTASTSARNVNEYIYAGNVLLNRWKVLVNFGKALAETDKNARLSVYTPDVPPKNILAAFEKIPSVYYGGRLTANELENRLASCGTVVHVESFDRLSRKITRLSISTKIPEYMKSGAPIVAIGPANIASMNYLSQNSCALCVFDPSVKSISDGIKKLRSDPALCNKITSRASELAQKEHNVDKNAETVKNLILCACKDFK